MSGLEEVEPTSSPPSEDVHQGEPSSVLQGGGVEEIGEVVENQENQENQNTEEEDDISAADKTPDSEPQSSTTTEAEWTIIEKDEGGEVEMGTEGCHHEPIAQGERLEEREAESEPLLGVTTPHNSVKKEETDSDSIITLSDEDDPLVCVSGSSSVASPPPTASSSSSLLLSTTSLTSSMHSNLASYVHLPEDFYPSYESQSSVLSDGIPIRDGESGMENSEQEQQQQYEWSREGQNEEVEDAGVPPRVHAVEDGLEAVPEAVEEVGARNNLDLHGVEDEQEEVGARDHLDLLEDGEELEAEDEQERPLGEPGYDLYDDDDGLPGAPLPPLPQSEDLYPSQELDENYQSISRGFVYKHQKNFQLNYYLTGLLVVVLAMVIGLGVGHFLGLSEKLEIVEMYDLLQEERLDELQDELVTCISGDEGHGGDDQDLDDRVIRQLWEENKELREQVHQFRRTTATTGDLATDQAEEAMAAVLRDRINDLLTANADLEREVARLRYSDAARGVAESTETLEKLRQTRDMLNTVVTENDLLRIQVGKSRYGGQNGVESQEASESVAAASPSSDSPSSDSPLPAVKEGSDIINSGPWPSKRSEEISKDRAAAAKSPTASPPAEGSTDEAKKSGKTLGDKDDEDNDNDDDEDEDDDQDDDDDEHGKGNPLLKGFSKHLSFLVSQFGSKIVRGEGGGVDWDKANSFVAGLQKDIEARFLEVGSMAKEDLNLITTKFKELKNMMNNENMKAQYKSTTRAAVKMVKSLVEAVKDLRDAGSKSAGKSSWLQSFRSSADKVKVELENKWSSITYKWNSLIETEQFKMERMKNKDDANDDDDDDDDDDDNDERDFDYNNNKNVRKDRHKRSVDKDIDEEGGKRKRKMRRSQGSRRGDSDSNDDNDDDDESEGERRSHKQGRKSERRSNRDRKENKRNEMNKREERERGETRENEEGGWIFQRARHRGGIREEEQKSDWYLDRKYRREEGVEDYPRTERKRTADSYFHSSRECNGGLCHDRTHDHHERRGRRHGRRGERGSGHEHWKSRLNDHWQEGVKFANRLFNPDQ